MVVLLEVNRGIGVIGNTGDDDELCILGFNAVRYGHFCILSCITLFD
jgi:hypothetical protein